MIRYVLANWKSHKTLTDAEAWLDTFSRVYAPHPRVKVILAPPTLYLVPLWQKLKQDRNGPLTLAAQDLSPFPLGAYTGAVTAAMLENLVEYAILGHSERRRYFHETNQDVANKTSEARAAKITPIVCVDLPYARAQLAALQEDAADRLIIGYGPVEAIGIDNRQDPAMTQEAIAEIQAMAPGKPILYGGSVSKDNAGDYLGIAGVAGLMVGTASLDPREFASICTKAATV